MEIIERAKAAGIRAVNVAFSGGKDSIATLDLCVKHFDHVAAYHMHMVRGLSWEEQPIAWAEKTFGIKVIRLPSPFLSMLLRQATFRHVTVASRTCPRIQPKDIDAYVRSKTGFRWIATGERARDSLERQAYIKHTEGVDHKRGRFYPVGFWREQDVSAYLQIHRLPTPKQYTFTDSDIFKQRGAKKREFGGFQLDTIAFIRETLPDDYAKIRKVFPLIEGQYTRWLLLKESNGQESSETPTRTPQTSDAEA